ncbi:hypothetical protein SAMD00019534_024040 [Acytostelium subglobosum LB1]|uniref:hypothetical protein n=1 Tax=Acytostelium subglobosum LB1 TaxID=1410327 RepID=UPI0006450154|nr:hypothetical protein SAMD00019534_024040 [Acytostelium subglobosum LB1]GAM19229.1 hypothetical protein SAMD00019534_024040 [Acytostelium subglobosum LB1]|eukprot:XP_012757156.1 hypothetical protein SAMD00019534_024040 [Acytostelium subglobosum LB1]
MSKRKAELDDECSTQDEDSDYSDGYGNAIVNSDVEEEEEEVEVNEKVLKKQRTSAATATSSGTKSNKPSSTSTKTKTTTSSTTSKTAAAKSTPGVVGGKDGTIKMNSGNNTKTTRDTGGLIMLPTVSLINHNELITTILNDVATFEKNIGATNKVRIQCLELDGVGVKLAKKIQEILDTGKLKKLEKLNSNEKLLAINTISKVSGIGPVIAKKLVVDDGITTIEALRKIKATLNHHQQVGLKYFDDIETRVPRDEIERIEAMVKDLLKSIDKKAMAETCGSYRRGAKTSGDIDILLTHPSYTKQQKDKKNTFDLIKRLVDAMKKSGIIIDDISLGPMKYMGCCICPSTVEGAPTTEGGQEHESTTDNDTTHDEDDDVDKEDSGEEVEEDDSSATEPENEEMAKKAEERKAKQRQLAKEQKKQQREQQKKQQKTKASTGGNTGGRPIVRRIDLKLVPIESYYFGLLHNTGSDEFNRQMRAIALSKGFTLSEYSINTVSGPKKGEDILVNSEKEIFDIIGMHYYPPTERSL